MNKIINLFMVLSTFVLFGVIAFGNIETVSADGLGVSYEQACEFDDPSQPDGCNENGHINHCPPALWLCVEHMCEPNGNCKNNQ